MATAAGGQGASTGPARPSGGGPARREGLVALAVVAAVLALTFGLVALLVADDGGSGGGPVETVAVDLGEFFVEPDRVEVPSGSRLQVEVTNGGDAQHDLTLEGDPETGTERLAAGESQSADLGVIDADAQAWCTVPGHKEQGMVLDIVATEPTPEETTTTAP